MKFRFLFLVFILNSVYNSAQQPSKLAPQQQPSVVKLLTRADTIQYSLGAYIGQWFVKNGFNISNKALFQRGMDDALQSK
ncbi:MAG TPA: hypothetical protein VK155_17780, partial [Bacteroidales bacterium]|nr:hypothetical protein [Bacteroidales bacterium]